MRTAAASWAAAGVSPCTQIVSTRSDNVEPSRATTSPSRTIRTTRSATCAGVDSTAPATCRGVNDPSASYERSANASAAVRRPAREPAESSADPGRPTSTSAAVERRGGPRDRLCDVGTAHAHVVEGAVRLHVAKRCALRLRDRAHRPDLIEHEIGDVSRFDAHLTASKTREIRKPRMRADRHARLDGHAHGMAHHCGIARMKSASDAAGRDAAQEILVVAGFVCAEGLADVGVEVDSSSRDARVPGHQ